MTTGLVLAPAAWGQTIVPESASISGLVGHPQTYPLSCESRSAADWAAFWGVPVSETEFFDHLPQSDNPEVGFVGDVYGAWGRLPPEGYGVHAAPVAALLRDYGLAAEARYGLTWPELQAEIVAGRPTIVWIVGRIWAGTPESYLALDGSVVTVARYEHTMILVGYDATTVTLVDAADGRTGTYRLADFLTSWAVLGNMAVVGSGPIAVPSPQPLSPNPQPPTTYVVQPGDYLGAIATRLGVPWPELAALNGLTSPYIVWPGQVLLLSGGSPAATPSPPHPLTPAPLPPATYTVRPGEYLTQIAQGLGLDWQTIAQLNGLTWPYVVHPGQVLQLPAADAVEAVGGATAGPETYVTQPSDTLASIARQFGLHWPTLAALNNLWYPYTIYPGQVIHLR